MKADGETPVLEPSLPIQQSHTHQTSSLTMLRSQVARAFPGLDDVVLLGNLG
jgi:hypothetical protein